MLQILLSSHFHTLHIKKCNISNIIEARKELWSGKGFHKNQKSFKIDQCVNGMIGHMLSSLLSQSGILVDPLICLGPIFIIPSSCCPPEEDLKTA